MVFTNFYEKKSNEEEIQSGETEDTPVVKAIVNVEIKDFYEPEEQPSITTDH